MSYFDEVYERIKLAIHVKTQMELADALDIKQSSISDAKKRRTVPSEWLIKLYDKEKLNPDWLRWGKGSMRLNSEENSMGGVEPARLDALSTALAENAPGELPLARGETVRVLSPACEYEDGGKRPAFATHGYLVLPENFMGEDVLVFHMESSGMEPTLRRGAYVGVCSTSRPLSSGDVYALLMPFEGVAFRRIVQDSEDGFYLLCFDQDNLPNTRISAKMLRERLVGRLVWTLQTV